LNYLYILATETVPSYSAGTYYRDGGSHCREIYLLTAVWLTPGGSSTVNIYTQTIHRTTQLIWEECGPCPVFASYTLAFALQLKKKHGRTSVRVGEECQLARWKRNIQNRKEQ